MLEGAVSTAAHAAGTARVEGTRPVRRADPQTRRRELVAWLSALSLAGLAAPIAGDQDAEAEATAVARRWLGLLDDGQTAASWAATAPTLRGTIGHDDWSVAVRAVRAPLGRCRARTLRSQVTYQVPSCVADGPSVVVRFESAFERRRAVTETVATARGEDGHWRVAAYFVG